MKHNVLEVYLEVKGHKHWELLARPNYVHHPQLIWIFIMQVFIIFPEVLFRQVE